MRREIVKRSREELLGTVMEEEEDLGELQEERLGRFQEGFFLEELGGR